MTHRTFRIDFETSGQCSDNQLGCNAKPVRYDIRHCRKVVRVLGKLAGTTERAQQSCKLVRVLLRPLLAQCEHFFRHVRRDFAAKMQDMANSGIHGN